MPNQQNPFDTLKQLQGSDIYYYSLPKLEEKGFKNISRLPVSIRIMLESVLRKCDGKRITEEDVTRLAGWSSKNLSDVEVPFTVSRVILQDFTGVPLLVDLAAMRNAVSEMEFDPKIIEPQVPVDLVIDHSVQVDRSGTQDAFLSNLKIEFERNRERYEFLKWGQEAFQTLKVIPPGIGIVHQVNLEHLASVVIRKEEGSKTFAFPDTLVGTDSHTTMINGLGCVGWGVGGIEAEAAMLGQPVFIQMPEVIGFHLEGKLREGVTATDLTLRVTEILRKEKVVGKFVEFHGEGAETLSVADRATIGNMAPEYGATIGFFPVDNETLNYLRMTGRSEEEIRFVEEYLKAQGLFGIPRKGDVDYTKVIELNLATVSPCVSGPKRPQDRIEIEHLKGRFTKLLTLPVTEGGYGLPQGAKRPLICVHPGESYHIEEPHITGGTPVLENGKRIHEWSESEMVTNRPHTNSVTKPGYAEEVTCDVILSHGSVVIAAITSCTNTSNPSVMLAAGLLAKKAVEKGLKVNPKVKTSLAPGSRVVTDYLEKVDLQKYLDKLGFQLVAYGCTTCIGNSGPLDEKIESAIKDFDLVAASVLSGNRNFEARIHGSVKANFLMSPPLVVAFAIAGKIDLDLTKDPIGFDKEGKGVYLKDIWPTLQEIREAMNSIRPEMFKKRYSKERIYGDNPVWKEICSEKGTLYDWNSESTYIQHPPYFKDFSLETPATKSLKGMRALALFGDSVTTDHISPAGSFLANSPAGQYLLSKGIKKEDFNSYGSRRGNHHVMKRGTFANVRIRNLMTEGKEGGVTRVMPEGNEMSIFEASKVYAARKVPLIIFAGSDYGMGSSRDWAAKGSALLGVEAVVAKSFERIHRSNLIGMGVLPLQFLDEMDWHQLKITGTESFSIEGIEGGFKPKQKLTLVIEKGDGARERYPLLSRIDTGVEVDYYIHGGIMPFVLRQILSTSAGGK